MKKIITILAAAACLWSCRHDISDPVNYNIILDPSNTYIAGEPVHFTFGAAQVDNILFYSGEPGHKYENKDRYTVPIEEVKKAILTVRYQAQYGLAGGMDVYVSKSFDGLDGNNAVLDRATATAMSQEAAKNEGKAIPGWEKLDYKEGKSGEWTSQEYDLSDYLDRFCIAFHWNTPAFTSVQRTYRMSGEITLELEGFDPSSMDLASLGLKTVMVNSEVDAYMKNNGNGSIILNKPDVATIICQGVAANALPYALDGWIISTPRALNKVSNDKGLIVKTMDNDIEGFDYIYTKPGCYKATFVGINANYQSTSKELRELSIIILEKTE